MHGELGGAQVVRVARRRVRRAGGEQQGRRDRAPVLDMLYIYIYIYIYIRKLFDVLYIHVVYTYI